MSEKEYIKGNNEIAKIFKWKNTGMLNLPFWIRFENDNGISGNDLNFHLKMDFLMDTLDFIHVEYNYFYIIQNNFCCICSADNCFSGEEESTRESIWKALVEFSKHYNK
jgi:hypothetical protein